MKGWWLLLFLVVGLVGVSSLSAAIHTHTTALPLVVGPYPAVFNGDFEQGPVGWESLAGAPVPVFRYPELGVQPVSGEWAARLTIYPWNINQSGIVIPPDRPYLTYWRLVRRGTGECDPELTIATVSVVGGGNPEFPHFVSDTIRMCTDTDWEQRTINLSSVAGSTVSVHVLAYVGPDSGAFYVDDFRFVAQP
jgi:hypothetical protein